MKAKTQASFPTLDSVPRIRLPPTQALTPVDRESASAHRGCSVQRAQVFQARGSARARKLAAARVDPEILVGTGGRVIERDIEAFLAGRPRLSASARSKAMEVLSPQTRKWAGRDGSAADMMVPGAIEELGRVVKGIRKVIAERMMQSPIHCPTTLHSSFELTAAQAYRKQRLETESPKFR